MNRNPPEYDAPEGAVWVCGACGKMSKNKVDGPDMWDSSCFTWAVLCQENSLVFESGRVIRATAWVVIPKIRVEGKITT